MDPSQRMWSRRRLIQVVELAKPADPAHGVQTLLKGCEAAIRAAAVRVSTVVCAPWIVLSFGATSNADDANTNYQHE